MKTLIPLAALFVSLGASAGPIVISDDQCIPATLSTASKYLVDYAHYTVSSGAAYRLEFGAFGRLTMLEMIKSQSATTGVSDPSREALVWVVLRPLDFKDAALYPRMLLQCSSTAQTGAFALNCDLRKDKQHYGVSEFHSRVELLERSTRCKAGQVELSYRVTIEPDPAAVAQIKAEAMRPYPAVLAKALGALFDEEAFFKNYFRNLYSGWVEELSR